MGEINWKDVEFYMFGEKIIPIENYKQKNFAGTIKLNKNEIELLNALIPETIKIPSYELFKKENGKSYFRFLGEEDTLFIINEDIDVEIGSLFEITAPHIKQDEDNITVNVPFIQL